MGLKTVITSFGVHMYRSLTIQQMLQSDEQWKQNLLKSKRSVSLWMKTTHFLIICLSTKPVKKLFEEFHPDLVLYSSQWVTESQSTGTHRRSHCSKIPDFLPLQPKSEICVIQIGFQLEKSHISLYFTCGK